MREKEPEEVEEIIEEAMGRNVKDILIEMKDVSELMIDLAYSALVYDNEELAEDVVELEEHVNKLKYELEINTMVAAKTPDDASQLTAILHAASASEDISNAAKELVDAVRRDVPLHPVLQKAIKESDETILKVTVVKGSAMDGKTLKELQLQTETGMQVITLKRGQEWLCRVDKDTAVKADDVVIVRGAKEGVEIVKKLAKSESK